MKCEYKKKDIYNQGTISDMETNLDAHVKSPFYMDSGIQGFRNCELFKCITIISILERGKGK